MSEHTTLVENALGVRIVGGLLLIACAFNFAVAAITSEMWEHDVARAHKYIAHVVATRRGGGGGGDNSGTHVRERTSSAEDTYCCTARWWVITAGTALMNLVVLFFVGSLLMGAAEALDPSDAAAANTWSGALLGIAFAVSTVLSMGDRRILLTIGGGALMVASLCTLFVQWRTAGDPDGRTFSTIPLVGIVFAFFVFALILAYLMRTTLVAFAFVTASSVVLSFEMSYGRWPHWIRGYAFDLAIVVVECIVLTILYIAYAQWSVHRPQCCVEVQDVDDDDDERTLQPAGIPRSDQRSRA